MIVHPERGKFHREWDISRQGLSWKVKLKFTIDQVIKESEDFDDFLRKCADFGALVKYNPDHKIDLKFILAEQKERNPRTKIKERVVKSQNEFVQDTIDRGNYSIR